MTKMDLAELLTQLKHENVQLMTSVSTYLFDFNKGKFDGNVYITGDNYYNTKVTVTTSNACGEPGIPSQDIAIAQMLSSLQNKVATELASVQSDLGGVAQW